MNVARRIKFSRWLWAGAFLTGLLFILVASYIMTADILPLTVLGSLLLLFLAFALAMLFREMIAPSWIEREDAVSVVCWNNWKLEGTLVSAELQNKRKLALTLKDAKLALTPVGPMMGLAGLALKPLLGLFLPGFLAQSYYFKKETLLKSIRIDDERYKLVFPVFLLGRRKVKKWLG